MLEKERIDLDFSLHYQIDNEGLKVLFDIARKPTLLNKVKVWDELLYYNLYIT